MSLDESKLSQSLKAIRYEALERNWKVEVFRTNHSHRIITRDDGKRMHVFGSVPPDTSYAAAKASNDKLLTYELLEDQSLPLLELVAPSFDSSFDEAKAFMNQKGTVVVKPVDGSHGNGITINVTDENSLRQAINDAQKATKQSNYVIVQEQYNQPVICDLRILLIGGVYIGAIWRVPARVFGNGIHTIGELIANENNSERRGAAYKAELTTIDEERARAYLNDRVNDIPADGEEVQVIGVANYGAGGETVDVTDDIPQWLIDDALRAAKVCELVVAGIDFMISQPPKKESTREELIPAITEVNKAPLLTMHDTPTHGRGDRGATKAFMDYLAGL